MRVMWKLDSKMEKLVERHHDDDLCIHVLFDERTERLVREMTVEQRQLVEEIVAAAVVAVNSP